MENIKFKTGTKYGKIKVVKKKRWKNVMQWIVTITIVLALLINTNIIHFTRVNGHSMESTLYAGDTVFISKLPYIFNFPKVGDMIVLDKESVIAQKKTILLWILRIL